MAALHEPYATLVRLCLHTGVRLASEGLTLTWEDIDLERQRLTVQAVHAKNGSARVIPLSAPFVVALTALRPVDAAPTARVFVSRDGRPLRDPFSILARAAQRAQVSGFTPHVCAIRGPRGSCKRGAICARSRPSAGGGRSRW
jgi:integrase